MNRILFPTFLTLASPFALAQQGQATDYSELAETLFATELHLMRCLERIEKSEQSPKTMQTCLEQEKALEHIEVYGRFIGLETPEVIGRYYLDKQFIENAPKGNGDINELIALLPGVQLSESAYSIDSLQEIKAQDISISGGKPWQTGFYIDGLNYNSRQDPASTGGSANDIEGAVQTMNVNHQIVSSISVYDNNIPAEYGNFSGGVVEVETQSPFDDDKTSFIFGYRGTQSNWGSYHTITPEDEGENDTELAEEEPPIFKKNNYNMSLNHKFNDRHGLLVNVSYLESVISDISLQQTKTQERRNTNALIKYSYRKGWVDNLDLSFIYAPYENHNYKKDTLNSDYIIDGGAIGSALNIKHNFSWARLDSKLNFSRSENSREAPAHYYIWLQAKGKEWGQYADGNSEDLVPVSLEGGDGDLDKTQDSFAWKNKFTLDSHKLMGSTHDIQFGTNIDYESIKRDRDQDSYYYNSALQYSTALDGTALNCSGYTLDCIELSYYQPLAQLETQLGGELDLNNPEHILAYSNNVATTPQYFQSRIVRPQEHIAVDLMRYAMFFSDAIEVGRVNATVAVRAEYDDFFQNLNFSPRLSLGIDVFNDGNSMAILGASRYYDAGLLTYKVREQQLPSYTQYRPIRDSYLQSWLTSSGVADYKYRYTDVKSPYDDEFVIGWKQSTKHFGHFSIKYVKRNKYDQLARESDVVLENDGFSYIQVNNAGYGHSERYTFAWNAQYKNHSFWFNTSVTDNYSNVDDYDTSADNVPLDELVMYEGDLISKADLDLINENFARPLMASFGWSTQWFDNLTTSFTGNYSQGYDSAQLTGGYSETDQVSSACPECQTSAVLVPTYQKVYIQSRVLVNMGLTWQPELFENHRLRFRADISNLFDARTYSVNANSSGIEVGRQFWLGLTYSFN
ncbi:TonB-dependent receptor plug domain-containing protein [Pseudoalteromonas sp. MMG010]|uniref:TonB-dependent receptor plug domain-containing protein n=1 Tax=Pseudoalteromonas sp. MMG010 TaxID=2822685 RepID=UPI001B3A0ED3|nr:TonB-dependent receptor plug domain-containing protein [Pseudoalteromonas sp. MMG010]MBQ4832119.1 TonB-dependent receptor plug domain-containing protein [Pseudoalteromonas sp. MMG010]